MISLIWFLICHLAVCFVIAHFYRNFSINLDIGFEFPFLPSAMCDFLYRDEPLSSEDIDDYTEFSKYLSQYSEARKKYENVTSLSPSIIPKIYLFCVIWIVPLFRAVWNNYEISLPIQIITTVFCIASITAIPAIMQRKTKYEYKDSDLRDYLEIKKLKTEDYSCLSDYIKAEKERCELIIAQRTVAFDTAEAINDNSNIFFYLAVCFGLYCLPIVSEGLF